MKKIEAYQSEDGKFIGTEQQVKEYENKERLKQLWEVFYTCRDSCYNYIVTADSVEDMIDFMKESQEFKEFCKIVYGFKEY